MRTCDTIQRQLLHIGCWIFLLSSLTSCSLLTTGKKGVFYNEMSKNPEVITYDYGFVVETGNSNINSALLMYKITFQIDTLQKKIELKGYQAANKKYINSFKFRVRGYSKTALDKYDFYWIDPDKKENKLTLKL